MSALAKTKLKAAREAIGKKDYGKARDASAQVLEYEPDNYHAFVYLLALGPRSQTNNCAGMCFSDLLPSS
jgi:hypothetical protein